MKILNYMGTTRLQKISFLVLRLMSSLIFITAGFNHLFRTDGVTARLEKAPLGYLATWIASAETIIIISGIGLLAGGFLLLAGFKTRLAALLLLGILIPITLTIQVANAEGSGPLFKNIALTGVLLFFTANGAVYYGLDQVLQLRKKSLSRLKAKGNVRNIAVLVAALMVGLGFYTLSGSAVQAAATQNPARQPQKYAVLISQPNHLMAAVKTAETIKPNSPYQRESFVVMACGKSVEAFVKGSEMAPEFEKGKAAGVTFKLCGMSLKQFKVAPNTLVDGVEIIPNGLTYMFDLQQQGYRTVEL